MKFADLNQKLALGALTLVAIISLFIISYFNGTGEEADSFHHYLIAHFSIKNPTLYFDHWGKPFYTLLSSPFAQLGFIGSKLFNLICSLLSLWVAFLLSKTFKLEKAPLVILFIFLIPLNFQVNFSAFTEPLFAIMLLMGIWLMLKHKSHISILLISFLPMVRSEGLIILGIFALYLLYKREFKKIPLLLIGQVIFGLLAWLYMGKSPLWIFNEIPYAEMSSPYGSGHLFHFVEKLYYICGLPLLILFLLGFILSLVNVKKQSAEWNILVLGSFFAFFLFHSLAWGLGWFNSMGLKRVFGAVTPLMGIIMLYGLNAILAFLKNASAKKWVSLFSVLIPAGFLFTGGPAAVNWQHEMNLSPSQQLANQVGTYIQDQKIPYKRLIYADRYLQNSLRNDLYDYRKYWPLDNEVLGKLTKDDLIIWDNWHAPTDFGIALETLRSRSDLNEIEEFNTVYKGYKVQYVIFQRSN